MQKNIVAFLFLIIFSNCKNTPGTTDNAASTSNSNKTFPSKPLVIIGDNGDDHGPADIRMSITGIHENDSAILYKVGSTFSTKGVGFLLSVPKAKEVTQGFGTRIVLMSSGEPSDNLLKILDSLYGQKADASLQFTKELTVNFVNLKTMAKSLVGKDAEPYTATNEYKLFFEKGEKYAELYLNVNPEEHWIELNEKDEEYRPLIIDFLKK